MFFCSESFLFRAGICFGIVYFSFLLGGRSLEKELSSLFYTLKLLLTRSKVGFSYYYLLYGLDLLLFLFGFFYSFTYYISSSMLWSTSLKIDLGLSLPFLESLAYLDCC